MDAHMIEVGWLLPFLVAMLVDWRIERRDRTGMRGGAVT